MNKKVQKIVTSLLFVTTIMVMTTQTAFGIEKLKSYTFDAVDLLGVQMRPRDMTIVTTPSDVFISGSSKIQIGQGKGYFIYRCTYVYYSPYSGGFY